MKKLLFLLIPLFIFAGNLTKEDKEEMRIGNIMYQKVLQHVKISRDIPKKNAITRVGQKIAKATGKNYDWKFTLVENKQINAFCLPGGKVIVFTGLFKVIENDDQLATVLGHEIAHALLRHGTTQAKLNILLSLPRAAAKEMFGDLVPKELHPILDTVYEAGKEITVMRPYSRENELEADKLGIRLMYKAGYNPNEAIKLWHNMKNANKAHIPEFLSTHPDVDDRVSVIKAEIQKLKKGNK